MDHEKLVFTNLTSTQETLEEEKDGFDPIGNQRNPQKRKLLKKTSNSDCDEISDIVEKDTSDLEETIQNIKKFVTSTLKLSQE